MAQSNTAGLTEQLSCTGVAVMAVAYLTAFFTVANYVFKPRLKAVLSK